MAMSVVMPVYPTPNPTGHTLLASLQYFGVGRQMAPLWKWSEKGLFNHSQIEF